MRTANYRDVSSRNAELRARFARQMSDFARGRELVLLREARHLSQEDAAHDIGVSAKSLRSWEHGGSIRWDNAKRVAAFYEVDAETLVSRELHDPEPVTVLSADDSDRLRRVEEMLEELLRRTSPPPAEPDTSPPDEGPPGPHPPDEPIPPKHPPDEADTGAAETG